MPDTLSLDTINVLKDFDVDSAGINTGQTAIVSGYNQVGDGGGSEFYWDGNSTEVDNGGTIIIPTYTGFSGTGRWKRLFSNQFLPLEWFGVAADGSTDDHDKIESAVIAADSLDKVLVFPKGKTIASSLLELHSYPNIYYQGNSCTLKLLNSQNSSLLWIGENCIIEGFIFDGNKANQGSTGVQDGLILIANRNDCAIRNNTFKDSDSCGIVVRSSNPDASCRNNLIESNRFLTNNHNAVVLTGNCSQNQVLENTFLDNKESSVNPTCRFRSVSHCFLRNQIVQWYTTYFLVLNG